MNKAIESMLKFLLGSKYFGGKHFPESKLITSRTKWLNKKEKREFDKAYKRLVNDLIILREKKRTGKGSDWHVSLNSRKVEEINKLVNL